MWQILTNYSYLPYIWYTRGLQLTPELSITSDFIVMLCLFKCPTGLSDGKRELKWIPQEKMALKVGRAPTRGGYCLVFRVRSVSSRHCWVLVITVIGFGQDIKQLSKILLNTIGVHVDEKALLFSVAVDFSGLGGSVVEGWESDEAAKGMYSDKESLWEARLWYGKGVFPRGLESTEYAPDLRRIFQYLIDTSAGKLI